MFRKDITPRCGYCGRGLAIDSELVACKLKGVMDASASCRRFVYDPLKRTPPPRPSLKTQTFSKEDFEL